MTAFTLFSAVKNEGPFLVEWVTFHRLIGFDRVVIYSNDCTDGTDALLEALAVAGLVEHVPQKLAPSEAPQLKAATDALARGLFDCGEWVMWLDTDEFLSINLGDGTLASLRKVLSDADALAFHWRIFGTNGIDGLPQRLVSETFNRASRRQLFINHTVKTLFRYSDRIRKMHIHRPIWDNNPGAPPVVFLSGAGEPVADDIIFGRGRNGDPIARVPIQGARSYRLGQVNHYLLRSRRCFALKKSRGRGAYGLENSRDRHNQKFFDRHNKNDLPETTILKYEPYLSDAIAEIMTDARIRACHEACVAATEKALSQI